LLASGDEAGALRLWDVSTGREVRKISHTGAVRGVTFSPDGRLLASASPVPDQPVSLWDPATGKLLRSLRPGRSPCCVAFSPDGRNVASAGADGLVKVWDVEAGAERLTLRGHRRGVTGVAFHPGGRLLASAGGHDYTVKVWDTSRAQEALALRVGGEGVTGVA